MPLNIKTLLFILPIGLFVFWLASKHTREIVEPSEFRNWRNSWVILQSVAFLSPNIWLFYISMLVACFYFKSSTTRLGQFTLFAFLLSILPTLSFNIPAFGVINYLFTLTYPRALSLFILLPIFFYLRRALPKSETSLNSNLDKLVVTFIILIAVLEFRDNSFTNGLRFAFLYFIDYFLPYYVASRVITKHHDFGRVFLAILISISIAGLIGIFETLKSWHLYNHLVQHLFDSIRMRNFDVRGEILRSAVTFMSPIAFAYALMIALGLVFYFQNKIKNKFIIFIVFLGLLLSLFFTVSRGPWVGFVFLIIIFILTGKRKFSKLSQIGVVGLLALPFILISPIGQKVINLLPFVGEERADTIDYRQKLIEVSMTVFKQNPLLGSATYRENPLMEVMRQGEGIIDIVNSYINILLEYGLIGLFLFLSIFITALLKTYKITKANVQHEDINLLGRVLTAIIAAIMLTIFTVSSIDYIPWYYWLILGISSAYHRLYARKTIVAT